jgi:hypothetical protein
MPSRRNVVRSSGDNAWYDHEKTAGVAEFVFRRGHRVEPVLLAHEFLDQLRQRQPRTVDGTLGHDPKGERQMTAQLGEGERARRFGGHCGTAHQLAEQLDGLRFETSDSVAA